MRILYFYLHAERKLYSLGFLQWNNNRKNGTNWTFQIFVKVNFNKMRHSPEISSNLHRLSSRVFSWQVDIFSVTPLGGCFSTIKLVPSSHSSSQLPLLSPAGWGPGREGRYLVTHFLSRFLIHFGRIWVENDWTDFLLSRVLVSSLGAGHVTSVRIVKISEEWWN